jgi:pSer/pThr/pTyr-binding forkhead associated (FHA) protein
LPQFGQIGDGISLVIAPSLPDNPAFTLKVTTACANKFARGGFIDILYLNSTNAWRKEMAKLTLTFKGKTLHSLNLANGTFTIGREETNDLQIDSLAVAPRHATIAVSSNEKLVKQIDPSYPLIINGNPVEEHHLAHGDLIGVGKHQIFFSDTEKPVPPGLPGRVDRDLSASEPDHHTAKHGPVGVDASLQVLKGKNIGVVIPLRRAMTRLGTEAAGSAVIAHRKEGYFLSALVAVNDVQVNNVDIKEDSVLLNHGDVLKVGGNTLQFFCRSGSGED